MDKARTIYLQNALKVKPDGDIGPITRKAFTDSLIRIALKDIGIHETSPNHGEGIEKYWPVVDYSEGYKDRAPYCAAAVSYWVKQLGAFKEQDRPKTAAAFGFQEWGNDLGLKVIKNPETVKKGQIIVFSFSHVGIAIGDSDNKGNFATVEANTSEGNAGSQRDGGGVYQRIRNLSLVKCSVAI